MESVRGQLLVAGPALLDPNFWRTVVLVVEHNEEGALGLVLNRPSETSVGEAVPQLETLLDPQERLFIGGPVQPSAVIVLADFEEATDAALLAFDDVGVLGTSSSPDELTAGVRSGRAFLGHAGSRIQSPRSTSSSSWPGPQPAQLADAFSDDARGLWSDVLTRKGGSYALLARMPADPSMN